MTVNAITDTKKENRDCAYLFAEDNNNKKFYSLFLHFFTFRIFHIPHFTLRSAVLSRKPNSAFYTFVIFCIPQSAFRILPVPLVLRQVQYLQAPLQHWGTVEHLTTRYHVRDAHRWPFSCYIIGNLRWVLGYCCYLITLYTFLVATIKCSTLNSWF